MSTHPYIPLYVDDFEAATAHLSPEEDGLYNRLLRLCWRTPGCSLPDDPAWIARKIRVSPEVFERTVQQLLSEFFTRSRGRWIQRRLKREYDDISCKRVARKQAGKKGGLAKARKLQEKSAGIASILPADTRASPYPEPEPYISETNVSSIERAPRSSAPAKPNGFAVFWEAYPNKVGKRAAETAYDRALKRSDAETIFAGLERAKTCRQWADGFIPHPTTWLNQDRWADEPAEIARPPPGYSPSQVQAASDELAYRSVIAKLAENGTDPGNHRRDQGVIVPLPEARQIGRG